MTDFNTPLRMAQARQEAAVHQKMQQLVAEKETFLRLAVCMAKAMLGGREFATVDGHVGVPFDECVAVPDLFQVSVAAAEVTEEGVEDAEPVMLLVLRIEPKVGTNGRLVVP